ncbi:MAG: hypothetical protein WAV45_11645 [Propionibacteriaceae bacterium]|nr:hypothetical protein [Micropruina sp.]HBX79802.1 hypothetical protein [Propionibacteriaceae bacterium]HBY22269.1 hypothetical protein [Propionibacteriaceae bacterium]
MPWWSAEFIDAGRWRAARNAALKELRDGDELAAYNLAIAEEGLRKPRRARWALRLAASYDDPKGLRDFGVDLAESGAALEALPVLAVLARNHPEHAAEAAALAAFIRWEYLAEADEPALRAATETLTWVVCEYAECLVSQGRVDEAISALRAASEAGEIDALMPLGNLLTAAGETELGMAAYAEGYTRGDAFSAFNAGITLEKLGDLRGARAWIKKAAAGGDRKAVRWLRQDGRRLRAERRRGPRPARAS